MTKNRNKNQTVSRSQASVRTDTCLQIICIKFEFLHQISKFSFSNTDCFWPLKVHFMASRTSPPPHLQLVFFFFNEMLPVTSFTSSAMREQSDEWVSIGCSPHLLLQTEKILCSLLQTETRCSRAVCEAANSGSRTMRRSLSPEVICCQAGRGSRLAPKVSQFSLDFVWGREDARTSFC